MGRWSDLNTALRHGLLAMLWCTSSQAEPYVAFSLNQAERAQHSPRPVAAEVRRLGGISRPVAIVHDSSARDVIVVGELCEGEVLSLDDFVIALRAIYERGEAPGVSIDWTNETDRTRRQRVRFVGAIADTSFGQDLLDADVVLKKLGIGRLASQVPDVRSYFDLAFEQWKTSGEETPFVTRFWFTPSKNESYIAVREGVAVARRLKIVVRTEIMGTVGRKPQQDASSPLRDPISERFASSCTENLGDLTGRHPEIARLDPLFRLTALAEGMRKWRDKYKTDLSNLNYWLHEYDVQSEPTPVHFPVIGSEAKSRHRNGVWTMRVEGGVNLEVFALEVRDGSVNALKELVIRSRPSRDALTWQVPFCEALCSSGAAYPLVDIEARLRELPAFGMNLRTMYFPGDTPPDGLRTHFRQGPPAASSFGAPDFSLLNGLPGRPDSQNLGFSWPKITPVSWGGPLGFDPTRVGGVWLDKAATVAGEIGRVTALKLDRDSKRLVLVGEHGETGLPLLRLDDLAAVIHSIYVEGVDPYVSIDPRPGDLYGAKMDIRYSPGLCFTRAGLVMFEADYKLKEYVAGARNGKRIQTRVAGWECLAEIEKRLFPQGRQLDQRVWYRFWLKPDDIVLASAPDGKSLLFTRATVRLETENMVCRDGSLQRAEGVKDPVAEEFARKFTADYERYAAEYPAYERVRELAQIVGLVKWMREQGVEVDLNWVAQQRSTAAATPLECDSVWSEVVTRDGSGTLAGQQMHFYFGGVDLALRLDKSHLSPSLAGGAPALDGQRDAETVRRLRAVAQASQSAARARAPRDDPVQGAIVPGVARRVLGAYRAQAVDLVVGEGAHKLVLARHYDSLFRQPASLGHGWSLLLPRLLRRQPIGSEEQVVLMVRGGSPTVLPVYLLTDDFGSMEEVFHPDPSAARRGVVRYQTPANQRVRQFLVLRDSQGSRVVFRDGQVWQFDDAGYLAAQFNSGRNTQFQYEELRGGTRRLARIIQSCGHGDETAVAFEYDAQHRVRRAITSMGTAADYGYDQQGDLVLVTTPQGPLAYQYDRDHRLISTARDGRVLETVAYDAQGRLRQTTGPDGQPTAQYSFATDAEGRTRVTDLVRGHEVTYDGQLQLVSFVEGAVRSDPSRRIAEAKD